MSTIIGACVTLLCLAMPNTAAGAELLGAHAVVSATTQGGGTNTKEADFDEVFNETVTADFVSPTGAGEEHATSSLNTLLGKADGVLTSIAADGTGSATAADSGIASTGLLAGGGLSESVTFEASDSETLQVDGSLAAGVSGFDPEQCEVASLLFSGDGVVGGTRTFEAVANEGTPGCTKPPTPDLLVVNEEIELQAGDVTVVMSAQFLARSVRAAGAANASFDLDMSFGECTITVAQPDQTTEGTPGDDVICGTDGQDFINGLGGNDRILGEGGNDRLEGGGGNDTIEGGADEDFIIGDDSFDGENRDELHGGPGDDEILGGPGDDQISGDEGLDAIVGRCGPERAGTVNVGRPGACSDLVGVGETDVDTIEGGPEKDFIWGEDDGDILLGNGAGDFIDGGIGKDDISGGPGNEVLQRASGPDPGILGGPGRDTLAGFDGDDFIAGGGQGDVIFGGNGSDKLRGQGDGDCMVGGPNKDVFVGGPENDKLNARGGGLDEVHGNDGLNDRAQVDNNDQVDGVEDLSPGAIICTPPT